MLQIIVKLLTVIILICFASAFMEHDCNRLHSNDIFILFFEMDECRAFEGRIMFHNVQLELLQLPEQVNISVLACRVELDNVIYAIVKTLNLMRA